MGSYTAALTANEAHVKELFKAFPNVEKQDLMLLFKSLYISGVSTTFISHSQPNQYNPTPEFSLVTTAGGTSRNIKFINSGIAYPGVELTLANNKKLIIQSFYEFDNAECKIPLYMYDGKAVSLNIENIQPR